MVWFQCDDCGDNLKKPKLPHHFKFCSASRLSCIDCGKVFGQQDVESHTQCITEAEKYGPKGQVKASNGTNAKTKDDSKQKPDVDINVGLSERPPWFCSLCKSSATSKQTLLQHADGKKHRGKARAFHAANQQPNATAETVDNKQLNANIETKSNNQPDATVETKDKKQSNTTLETKDNTESKVKNGVVSDEKDIVESRNVSSSKVGASRLEEMVEVNASKSNKKRKHRASENGTLDKTAGGAEAGDDETIQSNGDKTEGTKGSKKAKCRETKDDGELDSTAKEVHKKEIKWKKLICSTLRSNPEGLLKFKKLTDVVLESLKRSGYTVERSQVSETLKHNITSSSRFTLEGKHVRLSLGS